MRALLHQPDPKELVLIAGLEHQSIDLGSFGLLNAIFYVQSEDADKIEYATFGDMPAQLSSLIKKQKNYKDLFPLTIHPGVTVIGTFDPIGVHDKKVFAQAAASTEYAFAQAINKTTNLKIDPNAIANNVTDKARKAQETVKENLNNPLKMVKKVADNIDIARIGSIVLTGMFNRGLGVLVAAHSAYLNRDEIAQRVKETVDSGKNLAQHFLEEAQRNSNIEMPQAISSMDETELLISGQWLQNKNHAKEVNLSKLSAVAKTIDF